MRHLIVAVFDTPALADAAEHDLITNAMIPTTAIRRYLGDHPIAATTTTYASETVSPPVESANRKNGFLGWLFSNETNDYAAHGDRTLYDRHVDAGHSILSVQALDEQQADTIMCVLEDHLPSALDIRDGVAPVTPVIETPVIETPVIETSVASAGASIPVVATRQAVVTPAVDETVLVGTEHVITLAKEQLNVGKRVVDRGATLVRRYVVETPVEAHVTLRDETTTIDRRTPLYTTPGVGTFEERTVELRHTSEVPVVEKVAKIAEEVVVRRDSTEHIERIRDTVRHEEVEVQDAAAQPLLDTGHATIIKTA